MAESELGSDALARRRQNPFQRRHDRRQLRRRLAQDRRVANRPARRGESSGLVTGRKVGAGADLRAAATRALSDRSGRASAAQARGHCRVSERFLVSRRQEPAGDRQRGRASRLRAYRQDIPGGEPTPILQEGVLPAIVTPDGQTILAIDGERKWQWYPVNGGASRPALGLTAEDPPARHPRLERRRQSVVRA